MNKPKVVIPAGLKPSPALYEVSAAELLAIYFNVDVSFIIRSNHKTADFMINGIAWELKSPTGSGKKNIQHQLQAGLKQSHNLVFDARRSKIHVVKIRNELLHQLKLSKDIHRLVLIDKSGRVVELTRE